MNLWHLGRYSEASYELQAALAIGPELGPLFGHAVAYFTLTLAAQGALAQAHDTIAPFIEVARQRGLRIEEGLGRWALGDLLARQGNLADAEQQTRQACELLMIVPLDQLLACSWLTTILLRRERSVEALTLAAESVHRYRALGWRGMKSTLARVLHAEALLGGRTHGRSPRCSPGSPDALDDAGRRHP